MKYLRDSEKRQICNVTYGLEDSRMPRLFSSVLKGRKTTNVSKGESKKIQEKS